MALRPCYLSQILLEEQQQVIFVTEQGGQRRIPIVIGPLEAMAIDRAIKGVAFPRPLTHDLMVNMLVTFGHRCQEIRIVDLKEGTFYAELVFAGAADEPIVLDCRPSDAIALMVRLPGVPLLVADAILEEAGT